MDASKDMETGSRQGDTWGELFLESLGGKED